MGSNAEQEMLKSVYNLEFSSIPVYKKKKFTGYDGVLKDADFHFEVATATLGQIVCSKPRAVLVIC